MRLILTNSSSTVQFFFLIGDVGMLSRTFHSRTIVADEDSLVAILERDTFELIWKHDKVYFSKSLYLQNPINVNTLL